MLCGELRRAVGLAVGEFSKQTGATQHRKWPTAGELNGKAEYTHLSNISSGNHNLEDVHWRNRFVQPRCPALVGRQGLVLHLRENWGGKAPGLVVVDRDNVMHGQQRGKVRPRQVWLKGAPAEGAPAEREGAPAENEDEENEVEEDEASR